MAGALIGALWAWIAPPIHGVVALTRDGDRVRAYLGNEADHFFIGGVPDRRDAERAGGGGGGAGVAVARPSRTGAGRRAEPSVGGAAAAAGAGVGAVLVRWRYGTIDIAAAPISPEHRVHYVTEAPAVFFGHSPLQIATTILFPAAVAALVYALIAVSTSRDDLGAWPPVEEPPVATDRTRTAADAPPVYPSSPSR